MHSPARRSCRRSVSPRSTSPPDPFSRTANRSTGGRAPRRPPHLFSRRRASRVQPPTAARVQSPAPPHGRPASPPPPLPPRPPRARGQGEARQHDVANPAETPPAELTADGPLAEVRSLTANRCTAAGISCRPVSMTVSRRLLPLGGQDSLCSGEIRRTGWPI